MKFNTFTFRAEWLEAAEALNDPTLKAELLLAITTYGLTGQFTPLHSPAVNALMVIIKAQIDCTPARRKAVNELTTVANGSLDRPESKPTDNTESIDIVETLKKMDYTKWLEEPVTNEEIQPVIELFVKECANQSVRFDNPEKCMKCFADYIDNAVHTSSYHCRAFFEEWTP